MTGSCHIEPIDVAVVAARVRTPAGDRILLTRRHPNGILPDSWELPGGKFEDGEAAAAAAARELQEETGLEAAGLDPLGVWESPASRPPVRLHAFLAEIPGDAPPPVRLDGPVDARWITPDQLADWPLPPSNGPVTEALLARLAGPAGPIAGPGSTPDPGIGD
ncbi:MAG: NUDIX domain-containing protein [Planctomycetota bacterium]|jgi:mutator protein MutT